MKELRGKTAALTGAASGIGRALALELAGRGCNLALADRDAEGLERTAALASGVRTSTHVLDVSDRRAVEGFAADAVGAHGAVDLVINNAGVSLSQNVEPMSYHDLEWIVGINLWGVVYGTKAFLPHLLTRPQGAVVNVSSVFGLLGLPSQSGYCLTKFAVRGFTDSLRHELAETAVTVHCVLPGGVKTNVIRNARHYPQARGGMDQETAMRLFEQNAPTAPERAARIIIKGVLRGRPRILVGPDARIIDWMARLMPDRALGILYRAQARKSRRAG